MINSNVLAIVVTFNRLQLLQRCINHLKAQSVMPHILVINNSSTDGTEAYLKANKIDFITQSNSGSAGGWNRGMKEGWKRDYDHIWMMDDDGFPHENALKNLLPYMSDTNTIAVSSVVVKEDAPNELVFPMPKLNRKGYPILFALKRKIAWLSELDNEKKYPYIHPFNGALINLQKAQHIGNIDIGYFMYGDETDYYYRLKKLGKIYTITDAIHYHPDVSKRKVERKKVYYFIRNTIIVTHLYLDWPFVRDFFTVAVVLYRINKQDGFLCVLSYLVGKNREYFYPAIKDGYNSNRNNLY